MEYWRRIFIKRLAELKESEGMTQNILAEMLGLSQGTIGQWHVGKRTPGDLNQFRNLEKALRLTPGTLTQPDPGNNAEVSPPYLVAENSTPYKSSIDIKIAEKAIAFLMDEIGMDGMKKEGAAWVAETIIMLYDLFSDPASENLSRGTILKMVSNLHR